MAKGTNKEIQRNKRLIECGNGMSFLDLNQYKHQGGPSVKRLVFTSLFLFPFLLLWCGV